jgi:hypothetical protein
VWCITAVILALRRRLRQEDHEFKVILSYILRPVSKTKTKTKKPQRNTILGAFQWGPL